ncbi:GLTSCR1 [Branchiostoma lanceolatum]|uniref:GLTSCR1 protein n=1 Tax=Branchiostoma lanceolatum TaxID=7740 RepID=A0A8J9YTY4_BRALA|nr:GLTSCR1 [Branchiostoma lanceolatum]
MVMEDGRCLLDVINDPQALNEFMQNDELNRDGQLQEENTVGGTQHAFTASPVQNSNQSTNENQGNVIMATGTMATYGHLVQKTTQSIAPHQGQNVLQQPVQLATSQAFDSSAPMQSFQVPQGAVLSQGNVVVQPGSFVQGTVSNGSSGSQGMPAPNRTLQPQFSSLARTQIVQQNTPQQQRHAAGQQPSSFQAAFEKAMLANKANNRQPHQQNQPLVQQNLALQQAVAQQPNLNPPILQQNRPQQVLQQPISQQHLQQTFSQQPLQQNISQQSLQQNISQQPVQQNISQQSVVQTMNSGSLQQNVVGQGGTKTISSLQALHNLNIVSHPSVQSSSISMAMPTVSTATITSSGQRNVHIQPKPPVAISPKLLPASSRPLVNISPKTSLPGSQTVVLQGANAQGVAPNINIANLVTLPGLRAPQGVLVQAQSLAQRISNVQRVPITTTTQANVTPPPQQQQTASPQTNILLQAAQQSNLMPSAPAQNVMPNSGAPQGNMLQQHGVTLVQRASPGVASMPQQQQSVSQHTVPVQIAPQTGNLQGQAPVYITSQSSPSPSNLQPAQAQQLRPVASQQQQQQTTGNASRANLAALSIAQQIQDQAAAQSRSGQAAIIPQNLLQKGAKILPANVAQQLLQQRKLSDQPGASTSPQIVAVNTSQPTSTVTTVTMTTVQTTAVQHSVTTTSSQPQVLVTTGAGGQPRLIVTLPQQPLPPQFQQREEKNMQLYQQALRIQKERQLQPGASASGQIAGTTIVTTQVQSGQQQGLLVQQQGMLGQQQSMMGQQVTSAGSPQTIQLNMAGQGSGGQQNFLGQQVLSGVVQQHGIMGQQQGIVGQQQGIVGQQQGIGGQLQQNIVGQQQQGVVGQQLQGIMGQQSMVGQQQQQGIMGQQQGTMGQQQQGMVVQQQQRILGQQQQSIIGQQQGSVGQQQQGIVGQQQQGIVGQQQGIMGQQQQSLVRQQLNIATTPQVSSSQQSPGKPMAPRPIAVSSPQQPIVTRAAAGQAQGSAQNPTGVTVVRQPVTLNVQQQGKQFITLTLQQQQHLAAIQAKLRTIVTPGKQLSPQEKQVVQQLQVLQSRILQQAKAQTQALAQNAAGQASLAQAAQKMTPIAQKPAAPSSTQAQGQGTIQQQRQQLNELLKNQTQVIRTTQVSGVTSVVSGPSSGATGQPTLVKLQPQGAQGPATVIQLTPQQKATLQQIQQQLKTLSPQQQQQFLKQQQHLILQLKNSKIAISPAALSAANAGNTGTAAVGQQQLVTVLKQQPVQTIAGKLVQSAVHGIKRPAPQPLSRADLIKNKGKLDQQSCLKPDYKTPFRNKEDAIKRLLPFHIHTTRDFEDKEIDKAEVTLETVSQSLVEKYHKMRDKYHHLLLQESMRTDPSAEMVMLWRIFVHEEKTALAQEKKLAVEGANGTPVAVPSASTSQELAEPPAAAPQVVGTATTAYLQPTAPTNTFPKSAATVTTSRSLTTASSVLKPHTNTSQELLTGQVRKAATQVVVPVARGGAVAMETKEPDDEESEDEVDMPDTVGSMQPATSYLNIDSSSMVDAVKATSPARLKSESEMAVASLLGEDSCDIDILNSDIANSDLPEDPGVDAVRSLTGALSPTRRNLNLDAANDFEDDSDEEPDSLNEQVQSAINSILELQGRGPLEEEDSPQDIFNPFSQDLPCSTSSEQHMEEDNALDEAVKSILF